MDKLKIVDLYVKPVNSEDLILKGINLEINSNDVVALLGPNGHGKSTLLNVIMSDPSYQIVSGNIYFNDREITNLSPDEKSKLGLFLSFQQPVSIPGVMSMDFFKMAINAHREKPIKLFEFYKDMENSYKKLDLDLSYSERFLNDGFSGGEKKKNEILQMLLLKPKFAFLDEIDSGLDVDALNLIAKNINQSIQENKTTFLIISHYSKLFELVNINRTIVIVDGKVVLDQGKDLAFEISKNGYSYLTKKYNIKIAKKKESNPTFLCTCGNKVV